MGVPGNTITFASNGLTTLTQNKGTGNDPANPYVGNTGLLNIGPTTPSGVYRILVDVSGSPAANMRAESQLVVIQSGGGGWFVEF